MEKKTLNTNPVQRLALHVAELSGKDFCDKRNGSEISTLYANARRYLRCTNQDSSYLSFLMYTDSYDSEHITRYATFGAILSSNILKSFK
jgi:hypothetical protein